MIIYEATKGEFMEHVTNDSIVACINDNFIENTANFDGYDLNYDLRILWRFSMDSEISINELKETVKKFCDDRDWEQFHNPKDLAIGISTEANELLSLFRFKNEDEMKEILDNHNKREDIEDETADIFFFLLRFAQMNNIDLSEVLKKKIEKNNKKYSMPVYGE